MMEEKQMEDLDKAYAAGARDVISRVSRWLDEDTVEALKEEFLDGV